jgi:hypothetical protein
MGGTYIFLSSVQAELLGLDSQALTLMPFQSPPTSPTGGPPTNALGSAFGDIVGAFQFAYNALVTTANFIENLPAELEALGQFVLGAIEQILHGLEAAVQALASVLDVLLSFVIAFIKSLISIAIQPVVKLVKSYGFGVYQAVYAASLDAASGGVTQSDTTAFWNALASELLVLCLAITIALLVILTIIDALSLGSGFLAGTVVGALVAAVAISTQSLVAHTNNVPQLPLPASTSHSINNLANDTVSAPPSTGAPQCSGCPNPISPANLWTTLGELFVVTFDSASAVIVLSEDSSYLLGLFQPGWAAMATDPVLAATTLTAVGIFLTVAAVILDAYDAIYPEPLLEGLGFWLGIISIIDDTATLIISKVYQLATWDEIDSALLGIGILTTGYSGYQYSTENV